MLYYLKKHWTINSLIVILQIAWAGTEVLTNVAMIQIAQGIWDMNMPHFLCWMGIDIGLWIVFLLLDAARTWAKSRAMMMMNNSVRADISATLLKKNYRDFHAQPSGEYLSWYTNDVGQMASLGWGGFYGIISVSAKIIFSITALAQMHWSLLVISAVVAIVMAVVPNLFNNRLEQLSETCAEEQAKAMSKMKDLLAGLDVLRFFGRSSRFASENREASEQMERPRHKQTCVQAYIGEGITLVNIFCQLGVNVLIGILSIQGIIIQGALMGGGNLCGTIYGGLATLAECIMQLRSAKPYFAKITAHAEESNISVVNTFKPVKKAITVENVNFNYGDKPILNGADFRFEKGGKYALTGPSGCGKSTLLKLLLGWLPEYTGKIAFDGRDARDYTTDQLQEQMSYIEQDVFLFNSTIRDNITLGGTFTEAQMEKALRDSALEGDLKNMPLGLDTPVGEEGSALSGGQKQRVAIARALIHNRSILLVDEGTSALDQKNADIVERSLLANPELTLILVSHHLSEERKAQFTKVYELETASAVAG